MTKQTTHQSFKSFDSLKEALTERPDLLWKRHHMPTGSTKRPRPIHSKKESN